jgi:hypothetical protein
MGFTWYTNKIIPKILLANDEKVTNLFSEFLLILFIFDYWLPSN